MNVGFDAKRAYHNRTGLGHYSRTLIESLATSYPQHQYYLFNPKPAPSAKASLFHFRKHVNVHQVLPSDVLSKLFRSAWRSNWVKKDIEKNAIDIYHGLSHEIPLRIHKTNIKSVVTIHDLIHERYPNQYNRIDVKIYNKKFTYACAYADKIIAISKQTKQDIINFYKIPEERIAVCYQSCNPAFANQVSEEEKQSIRLKYNLPAKFFLYVGSVIERKNLLTVCKAMFLLRNELDIPLVVIGEGGKYMQQVKDYVLQNSLESRIIFLSENPSAASSETFQSAADFPAIYQSATALIYPSFFEGFGIPVLEALFSKLPVITSNVSSLPEAAGNAACFINPQSAEEIAEAMRRIYNDEVFAESLKQKGWLQAQQFTPQKCATSVMKIYEEVLA